MVYNDIDDTFHFVCCFGEAETANEKTAISTLPQAKKAIAA
jgi:hypothetical protein